MRAPAARMRTSSVCRGGRDADVSLDAGDRLGELGEVVGDRRIDQQRSLPPGLQLCMYTAGPGRTSCRGRYPMMLTASGRLFAQCGAVDSVDCYVPSGPGRRRPARVVEHGRLVLLAPPHAMSSPDRTEHRRIAQAAPDLFCHKAHVPEQLIAAARWPDQLELEITVRIWRCAIPGLAEPLLPSHHPLVVATMPARRDPVSVRSRPSTL